MIRQAVAKALEGHSEPLSGRQVSESANLPYKATVDALCALHDSGIVTRIGRKYSASWALTGSPAACACDGLAGLEACWHPSRRAPDPHPRGGGVAGTPQPDDISSTPPSQNFPA